MPYYFNSNTYQAEWDNPDNISTTWLDDGAIGDRTSHNSCSSHVAFAPPAITAFYDAGIPIHVPRSQFGIETLSLDQGNLVRGQYAIEGSSDHITWSMLATGGLDNPLAIGYDFAVGLDQTAYFQYFRLSIKFDDGSDLVQSDRLALWDWRLIQPKQRDTMRDFRYLQSGGLLPLLTEAIPTISSSTAIFANAPAKTAAAEVTIKSADLVIMWNLADDASPNAATTAAGGGQTYGAGDRYWLEMAHDVLVNARAIQASATCTGTITYYGVRA